MWGKSVGRLHQKIATYVPGKTPVRKIPGLTRRRRVYIVEHIYEVGGRLSNWVSFRLLNRNGTLGKKMHGDYDFGKNFLDVCKPREIRILE